MKYNWALDRTSRKRFVKNFDLEKAEGKRPGEIVVYNSTFLTFTSSVNPGAAGEEKSKRLKVQMDKQVLDAKAKKHIYEGKAKKSKNWAIGLGILAALGFVTFASAQFIDQIAAYLLPAIEQITYAVYALAAVSFVSFGKAIRDGLVLGEIEKDILILDKKVELNKAKEDELNLMGLSLMGQAAIKSLNDNMEPIDVISADQLRTRDLNILLENYMLGEQVLTTGQYDRETLGGRKYELKPKKLKKQIKA